MLDGSNFRLAADVPAGSIMLSVVKVGLDEIVHHVQPARTAQEAYSEENGDVEEGLEFVSNTKRSSRVRERADRHEIPSTLRRSMSKWQCQRAEKTYGSMRLTRLGLLAVFRKGFRQFPIAQDTAPYDPSRLDGGQDQDISCADVAMEYSGDFQRSQTYA